MPIQVLMPKLSDTMETGKLLKWLKNVGDKVSPGDPMCEAESDKATMEIEAAEEGTMAKHVVPEGGSVPVGALIAILAGKGESVEAAAAASPAAAAPSPAAAAPSPAPAAAPSPARQGSNGGARGPAPAAAAQQVTAREPAARPPGPAGRLRSSPLARRLAREHGLVLDSVSGSGPQGRIVRRDIEQALRGVPAAPQSAPGLPAAAPTPVVPTTGSRTIPLSGMRKAIARRMTEAKQRAPHFYLTVEVDPDGIAQLRADLAKMGEKVSFNDVLIKASAATLVRHPAVNASYAPAAAGESEDHILVHGEVNVGLAVAIPPRDGEGPEGAGLITPVIRDAARKGLGQIARESAELIERARARRLKPEEYTGSTFSISNLGMYGIAEFAAIVNPPEAAILAVGTAIEQPVVKDGQIVIGRRMRLTLSGDHRVIDGAIGAQFLRDLKAVLESPVRMLL